jgi:farnesyl-diphosphate farnesyltransferase
VREDLEKNVVKGVSRSFYLTLRLLPQPMRGAASLGYLLARTSDTLADTETIPQDLRLKCLEQFSHSIAEGSPPPRWPLSVFNAMGDPHERHLLECTGDLFEWLGRLPAAETALVCEVLTTITGGQVLDLECFANAGTANPIALPDDAALDDYTWRVAGCVGEFWTKLGFLTLGNRFSSAPEIELLPLGRAYGKGLQLINILRDLPADLEAGRCYLPVSNPRDREALLACHQQWLLRARQWIGEGKIYADTLKIRRLRAATMLPALLAEKTCDRLTDVDWESLRAKIKIPRKVVYRALARAFF